MDPRIAVGAVFVLLISVLLFGTYAALMPTTLELSVYNKSAAAKDVTVVVSRDGQNLTSWKFTVTPDRPHSVSYPLDIGTYNVTVSSAGLGNVSALVEIPFRFIGKTSSDSFSVTTEGVYHGNVY